MRLLFSRLAGFMAIFIGLSIVVNIINLDLGYELLGPIFLFGIGVIFYLHVLRWVGLILFGLAIIALFSNVFGIDVAGVLFAFFFIFTGIKVFTGSLSLDAFTKKRDSKAVPDNASNDQKDAGNQPEVLEPERRQKSPRTHHSFIGDLRLLNQQFELNDMNISYSIGDVKIDLSKAIIPEGESVIAISGIIGDVDIYVPHDLDVAVTSSVTLGNFDVLGYKQNGVNRQIELATKGYQQSSRRVKISVSLFIGDVDVRFL